jgi:hypothetical protein
MPILGAVVTLVDDPALAAAAVASLTSDPRITVGERDGALLPVVLDTRSREEERSYWRALQATPGVLDVRLAFADFSDLTEPPDPDREV